MSGTIEIHCDGDVIRRVQCFARSGDLAVTFGVGLPFDAPGEWRITHVPSGVAIPYLFKNKTAARSAMRALRKAVDWPKFMKKMAAGERPERMIRAVKRACKENGGFYYTTQVSQRTRTTLLKRLRETIQ